MPIDRAESERRRLSFGSVATIYERSRPEYPPAAVGWVLAGAPGTVVDIGAGTGKLTRAVLACGREVVAVEPDPAMREVLSDALPEVPVLAGSAESIPCADASAGAVVAGQAWHWFDAERAGVEIARVLTPGGRLGVIWNLRDESAPWVKELGRLLHTDDGTGASRAEDTTTFGPQFGPIERRFFHHEQRLRPDELVDLAASRSYTITLPEADRAVLLRDVARLADREAHAGTLVLPYTVECLRADRPR